MYIFKNFNIKNHESKLENSTRVSKRRNKKSFFFKMISLKDSIC